MKHMEAQERSYLIEAIDRKTALSEAQNLLSNLICKSKAGCRNPDECDILKKISKTEEDSKDKKNRECSSRNILIIDSGNISQSEKTSYTGKKVNENNENQNNQNKSSSSQSNTSKLRRVLNEFTCRTFAPDEFKAVIITDADKLSVQSQNTLLKILEEPPPRIIFILTTAKKRKLLPTILSRCIIQKAKSDVKEPSELSKQFDLTDERAQIILNAANGDFYYAQKLVQSDYFKHRDDMIEALDRIWKLKNFATSAAEHLICEDAQENTKDSENGKEPQKKASDKRKNTKIDPEIVEKNLEIALIYIQDIINYKYGTVKAAANADRIDDIARHSKLSDLKLTQTAEKFAQLIQKMALCKGLNVKLGVTNTLFDILEAVI